MTSAVSSEVCYFALEGPMTTLTEFVEEQIADGAVIGGSVVVTAADGSGFLYGRKRSTGLSPWL